jgi:PAS domain S-box-containing protein
MDTILVVEDDPVSAMLLQAFCEQEGYPVIVAASGAEARAALGENAIALVLLDLRLPDVDGVELMREIRQGERPPDVIITTAHAGRGSAIAGIEAGAAGYIVKPVEIPRLRALVNGLLEQRRLRAENAALYQQAEREQHRLKALYEVASRLASVQDCWQIIDLIVREATRLLGVEAAAVRLVEGEELVLRAWTESAAPLLTRRALKIGESLTGCVAQTGEPISVCDLGLDPRYDPTHKQAALALGFHAFLGIPLRAEGRILGTLSIYGKVPRSFQPDEIALLSALGDQASLGIDRARLFQREQERRRQLEVVRGISEEITREMDLPILLGLITQRAVDLLGAGQGMIRLWDETDEVLVPKAWIGGDDHRGGLRLRLGEGAAGTAAERRQGMIVNDFRTSPYVTKQLLQQTSHTAVLAEPLLYRGRLVGVVSINREQGTGPFTSEDQTLVNLFASQAAIAIENARLHEATSHRAERLATLNAVSRSLTTALDSHAVIDRILSAAQSLIPGCACRLWRCTEKENSLTLIGSVGMRNPEAGQSFRFRAGQGLVGTGVSTRRPVTSSFVRTDPRFSDAPWAEAEGLLSYIGLPLMYGEQVVGFLSLYTRTAHVFPTEEVDLLNLFAGQAAIALENARLFEETQAQRARLAEVFDSAVEGIFQIAPGAGFLSANPAFVHMLGYESLDDLRGAVGDPDRQLYLDPDRRAAFHRMLAAQGAVSGFESQVLRKNGIPVWIAENTRMLKDAEGRILYYEGFAQDISERKQADQMKSDFVSFVTHQLRTPLAGIKWLLELASQEPDLSEDVRSYIADAREADERLVGLVNDLLDVSRLERGKLTITPKEVDLAALTQSVLDEMQPLIAEKGHRITFEPVPSPPVWADPQLLRQVVLNMTSNAVKYTPPGGAITVTIRPICDLQFPISDLKNEIAGVQSQIVSPKSQMLEWSIQDNGIGIPKASQARLFEKFYRAENVLTIETEGTGLGLYLVRLILEQFDGRVWCESEEGQGSRFLFTVPLQGKGRWG